MAMTGAGMKAAILSAISGVADPKGFDAMWDAIANAIVNYIHANAVVSGSVTVTSVSGVTAGAGVSGAGTGSMSAGTIS